MSYSTTLGLLASVVLLNPAAATAQGKLEQPGGDFNGKHTIPANTTGSHARLGTLLNGGEIEVGKGCKMIRLSMAGIKRDSFEKDLEGAVRVGDDCKDVAVYVEDSFDTTGKLFVGDNCSVEVMVGSDVRGTVVVGKNSTVIISYKGDTDNLAKQVGAGSVLDLNKR